MNGASGLAFRISCPDLSNPLAEWVSPHCWGPNTPLRAGSVQADPAFLLIAFRSRKPSPMLIKKRASRGARTNHYDAKLALEKRRERVGLRCAADRSAGRLRAGWILSRPCGLPPLSTVFAAALD
jgi:hypothetical protein